MDRVKVIEILENEMPGCGDKLMYTESERCEAYAEALALLRDPAVCRWISVEDDLPKKHGEYLVSVKNMTGRWVLDDPVFVANFCYGQWVFQSWEDNTVTHWMPKPGAAKGV